MKVSWPKLFVLAAVIAVICASAYVIRWMEIDRCLDSGGRWAYDAGGCEK